MRRPWGGSIEERSWALLDLLDGGAAPWLRSAARSQTRQLLRRLAGSDEHRWRSALRARSQVVRCRAHPAALARLIDQGPPDVLRSGEEEAVRQGIDLVALGAVPQVYVRPDTWSHLVRELRILTEITEPNLLIRLPRGLWPFEKRDHVGMAALAADLLDSPEPRAVAAGVQVLNQRCRSILRPQ